MPPRHLTRAAVGAKRTSPEPSPPSSDSPASSSPPSERTSDSESEPDAGPSVPRPKASPESNSRSTAEATSIEQGKGKEKAAPKAKRTRVTKNPPQPPVQPYCGPGHAVYQTAATRHIILSLLSRKDLTTLARVDKEMLYDVAQLLYRVTPHERVKAFGRQRGRFEIYRHAVRTIDMTDYAPLPSYTGRLHSARGALHVNASIYNAEGLPRLILPLRKACPNLATLVFGNSPALKEYEYDAYTVTLSPPPERNPDLLTGHIDLVWALAPWRLPLAAAGVDHPKAPDGFTLKAVCDAGRPRPPNSAHHWKYARISRHIKYLPRAVSRWNVDGAPFAIAAVGDLLEHMAKGRADVEGGMCEFECELLPPFTMNEIEAAVARTDDGFRKLAFKQPRLENAGSRSQIDLPRMLAAVRTHMPSLQSLEIVTDWRDEWDVGSAAWPFGEEDEDEGETEGGGVGAGGRAVGGTGKAGASGPGAAAGDAGWPEGRTEIKLGLYHVPGHAKPDRLGRWLRGQCPTAAKITIACVLEGGVLSYRLEID